MEREQGGKLSKIYGMYAKSVLKNNMPEKVLYFVRHGYYSLISTIPSE